MELEDLLSIKRNNTEKRFSYIPHGRNRDEMKYLLPSRRKMDNVRRRITHLLISFSCTIFECLFNGEENERYPHIDIFLFSLTPFEVCVDEKIILPCSSIAFLPIEQCARWFTTLITRRNRRRLSSYIIKKNIT